MRIETTNLGVSLGRREILRQVGFVAEAGAVTVIAGPNGSGKTTLMRALAGDLPYSGSLRMGDHELWRIRPERLARWRGVMAQESTLSFPFTVGEIIRMGILDASQDLRAIHRRIEAALDRVDLSGFAGRFYQELSGGERQRVQLARVLCQIWDPIGEDGPRWLFLDEPVSSLDVRHQLSTMELARSYAERGGGVIAILHDLNLTAMFADRIYLLNAGRIAASGAPREALRDRILQEVFGCPLAVGSAPADGLFVLPQSAGQRD